MALFQDVEAPYLTLEPGSTPTDAPAGMLRFFVDLADGLLKSVDDAGAVVTIGGGGGGGGSSAVPYFAKTSGSGDINLGVVSAYADITGLSVSVAAVSGDLLHALVTVATYNENGADQDIGINVAGTIKVAGGAASQGINKPMPVPVQHLHTVASGDISSSHVTVKAQVKAPSGNTWIYNNSSHGITGQISVVNYGQ